MICVENNLILIVLIFAMISVTFCSNYCDFEKTICFNKKHIGCKTSVFGKVQPYVMNPMADELKQYILHELNTFRNDIAMGKYEQDGFPKASNLRTLRWNNEFSYLAKLCIEKLPNWSIWPCFATNKFETPILKRLSNVGNSTGDQLFHIFIDFFTSTKELKLKYNEFYHENNYEIGCSLGSITVNGDILNNASCILNKFTIGSPLNTSYDFGEPCSKCGMWNEVCDDRYPGLCAPMNIKGEKGAIGLQGVTGSTGPIGPPGIKGDAGIKGEIGENGSIGLSGLPGMDGQRGKIGPVGPPGENGIDGSPGQKGESGRDGIPGFVGLKGEKGSSGQIGIAGIKGESGTNGIPGSPGLPGDNCKPETFGTQYFTDSQYPMSFWILYSVIGILVCASFIFTWKMNRPPKLGSSNSTMELR